jgi:hypothetical protein
MARKPQVAELKLRVPVELHRTLKSAARKNHRSVNQEVNQLLQRSFFDQGVEALIQSTAQRVAIEVKKEIRSLTKDLIEEFNTINRKFGYSELPINLKKGEDSNG